MAKFVVSYIFCCVTSLLSSSTLAAEDVLQGKGKFDTVQSLNYWAKLNQSAYDFQIAQDNSTFSYLKMHKKEDAQGAYDDGIYLNFGASTPAHISVKMQTKSPDVESCDLRLTSMDYNQTGFVYTKREWSDVAFFRFGYYNFHKMNLVNMVSKFTNDTWYHIDLLINWDRQTATIYVDGVLKASDIFFTNRKKTISNANAIILYNLSPNSTCLVKDLQICNYRCSGGEELLYASAHSLYSISLSLISLVALLLLS